MDITLTTKNNEILVSSREVAENFGKRHDKLTSGIKKRMYGDLIGSPQNGGHPFFSMKILMRMSKIIRLILNIL